MLKLNPDPTFENEVAITVPGQAVPGTVLLTFKYRTSKEYFDWFNEMREKKDKGKTIKEGKSIKDAFPEFVLGWNLPDEFNQENINIFLENYPAAYEDSFKHYTKALFESRVKN